MKKMNYSLLVLMLGFSLLHAQTTFEKTYGGSGTDYIYGFAQAADNGYILTGYTTCSATGDQDVCLVKTDSLGILQWAKSYGDEGMDYGSQVLALTDGYAIFGLSQTNPSLGNAGNDNLVMRTDLSGHVLWKKTFGGSNNDNLHHAIATPDGGFIAQGNTSTFDYGMDDLSLMKMNSVGVLQWYKTYGTVGNNDQGNQLCRDADGNILITGSTHVGYQNHDLLVVKTDSNGMLLWSKVYPYDYNTGSSTSNENGMGIVNAPNGDYFVLGNSNPYGTSYSYMILLRIDGNGNLKWMKRYYSTDSQQYLYGVGLIMTTDGNIVLQGNWGASSSATSSFLMMTDSAGTIVWSRTYGGSCTAFGADIIQTSDNTYVIAGGTTNLDSKGGYDCFLLKTAADGSTYAIGSVSVASESIVSLATDAGFNSITHNGLTVQNNKFYYQGTDFTGRSHVQDTIKSLYVTDVPNDNGKRVFVEWTTSASPTSLGMTGFDLYRYDYITGKGWCWDYVQGNIPVLTDTVYSVIAPTLYDSTITDGMYWSVFRIVARTTNPDVYTIIGPDSGYSVDNLPPVTPINGSLSETNGMVILQWKAPVDTNGGFKAYNIYRAETASFVPSASNKIASITNTEYTDNAALSGSFYKVTAVDSSGNESPSLTISTVTSTAVGNTPVSYNLSQNYPNPFNPTTKITFSLLKEGMTTLAVYDVLGQKVATVVDGQLPAGEQTVNFDASRLSSGVYFYKLQSGSFTQIRKMLLMK